MHMGRPSGGALALGTAGILKEAALTPSQGGLESIQEEVRDTQGLGGSTQLS